MLSPVILRIAKRLKITTVIHIPTQAKVVHMSNFPTLKKNINLLGITAVDNGFITKMLPKSMQPFVQLGTYYD